MMDIPSQADATSQSDQTQQQNEPLSKEDLLYVKKAIGFLHDVKATNSDFSGLVSGLLEFYKSQNKTVQPEQPINFQAGSQAVPTPIDGNTGQTLDQKVM